ncbi:MAG: hypothetical protein LBM77_13630 [Spirochaetaceae bacterium]|nr:hypothetical protein [Spirochaetaceae bacterium]
MIIEKTVDLLLNFAQLIFGGLILGSVINASIPPVYMITGSGLIVVLFLSIAYIIMLKERRE